MLAFDDFDVQAIGPCFKLGDCAGTEGVACAEEHCLAFFTKCGTEFGDAGGFACAVDAGHENDTGFFALRSEFERAILRGPESGNFFFEILECLIAIFHLAAAEVGAEAFDEFCRCLDTDVSLEQAAFDFVDECFVEAATCQNIAKAQRTRDDGFAGLGQALLELIDDGTEETQRCVLEKRVRWCGNAIVRKNGYLVVADSVWSCE